MGPRFTELLLEVLRQHRDGVSEHRLLRELAQRGVTALARGVPDDALALYRRHFRLFHGLYRLREQLRADARGDLHIHCLSIRLCAYHNPETRLPDRSDPLAAYYLDPMNLEAMTAAEAKRLIESGFQRLRTRVTRAPALAVLGLEDPVTDADIQRRYRALAQRHHPDRGGSTRRFQEISAAMAALRP